jgi:uncharacterized protein YbjT (DUF2867 family)
MKVLVYGATGSQAGPVVELLLQQGHEVRVLTRDVAKAAQRCPGAVAVRGDFDDPQSLQRASAGVDAVSFMVPAFLQSPENGLLYTERAIGAAKAGGARLVVWNTGGRFPEPGNARVLDKAMLATYEVLQAGGLPLTVIAPTTYMENLLGPGAITAIRHRDEVAYPVLATRQMGWIASRDVSAFVVAALERPRLAGRVFRVSGAEALTGPELAAAFTAVLGRPFRFRTLTPDEMRRALEEAYGMGAGDEVAEEYGLDQLDPNPPAKHYDMSPVLRDLPIEMTSIRTWIAHHAAEFAALAH